MAARRRTRAAWCLPLLLAAACLLGGCASIGSFFQDVRREEGVEPPPGAASAPLNSERAEYRLEVDAPDDLRKLLLAYLDLARFQDAPATAGVNAAELERLVRGTPAQARGLLETEGYFNAEVTVTREAGAEGKPLLRVAVAPGPRATVASVSLDLKLDAPPASVTAEAPRPPGEDPQRAAELRERDALREQWPLKPGQPFRQSAWADAKNTTLARLRADGYAAATWVSTTARVEAVKNEVDLTLVADSGPLYRLGEIRIEGLSRYAPESVRRLATFNPGDPYKEQTLLDYQERLQKLGLFEGASVELDADPGTHAAAPVIVKVKEQSLQQAIFGVGYSANTGPRISVEHWHRRVFDFWGVGWTAKNKIEWGPRQKTWEGGLTSHPLENLWHHLLSGTATDLKTDDEQLRSWSIRAGQAKDSIRFDRLWFGEITHARLQGTALTSSAEAVTANYHWIRRDLDNNLLPTRGNSLSLQGAVGYGTGEQTLLGGATERDRGPFTRAYARYTWYHPFGDRWYATARVEAGQVFTKQKLGVPETLLFRAGGDDSVRGYDYRSLGPRVNGVVTSGRSLLTGSVEVAHPISPNIPAVLWAVFVDAGDAADRFGDLKPVVGLGAGLRLRSPIGPLKLDLAYGEAVKQFRLHLSVGVTF